MIRCMLFLQCKETTKRDQRDTEKNNESKTRDSQSIRERDIQCNKNSLTCRPKFTLYFGTESCPIDRLSIIGYNCS